MEPDEPNKQEPEHQESPPEPEQEPEPELSPAEEYERRVEEELLSVMDPQKKED